MNTIQLIRSFIFIRIKLALLLLVLYEQSNFSQSYRVHSYSVEDGIASNGVHDVTQDSSGVMWFATDEGVSSYDGYLWKNYSTAQGLPKIDYYKIKCDSTNTIWAVPNWSVAQIAYFKNNRWNLLPAPGNIKENSTYYTSFDLSYTDNKQNLFLGTNDGIYIHNDRGWAHITKADGLLDNHINAVKYINNSLYVCTPKGISILTNGKSDNRINSSIKAVSKNILGMVYVGKSATNPEGRIWLFGDSWIGNIKGKKFYLAAANNKLETTGFIPRYFFTKYDGKNKLYYGDELEKFSYEISQHKVTSLNHDNGFSSLGSTAVFIDREANVWFTSLRGIDKIINLPFQNYFRSNGLLENEVTAILKVRPEFFVMGHNNGLSLYKNDSFTTIKIQSGGGKRLAVSRVMGLCKDSSGNIWIAASQHGVGKLTNNNRIEWLQNNNNIIATSITCDSKGTIWVGSNKGLSKISNGILTNVCINDESRDIRRVYVDRNGTVWGGRTGGLVKYKNEVCSQLTLESAPFGTVIYAILDYDSEKKLIGTSDGLFILENNLFKRFNDTSLKINKKIFFINKDSRNNYWFGTNDGVVKWDGKTSRQYSLEEGLAGFETNRAAFAEDMFGNILIGTDRGLSRYVPEYDIRKKPPVIKSLVLETTNSKSYQLRGPVDISYSQNNLTFTFKGISFNNEKYIEYRARLLGFENNWNEVGTNTYARYLNLEPGDYKFEVATRNAGGNWSATATSSIITIDKPFNLQWWFITLVICAFGFVLLSGYKYLSQLRYGHQLRKEVELRTVELKNSENKLRTIINSAPLIISIIDSKGKIKFINQDFDDYTVKPNVGDNIFDLVPVVYHDDLSKKLRQLFEDKQTIVFEYKSELRQGKERWLVSYVSPIITGDKITEAIGMSIDVTAEKNLEIARKKIEERQEAILEAIPLILYSGATPSEIDATWMTDNVKLVTGYEASDFTTKKSFWVNRIHPDDKDRVEMLFQNVRSGKSIKTEYRWQCSDGSYKWFLDYEVPKLSVGNGQTEYLGIWLDITEQKVAEIRLQKLNRTLLNFGIDSRANIEKLVELCGEELEGSCAEYSFIKDEKLNSFSSWHIYHEYDDREKHAGTLCYDIITGEKKEIYILHNLDSSQHMQSDAMLQHYKFKTFVGVPVSFGGATKGVLCVFYSEDKTPAEHDLNFMKILASAIAVEEERRASEESLQKSLREKEILLKEIHHRVKNNLQIISSLLYLQTEKITDMNILSAFQESHNRIRSMALVHEGLYQSSDLSSIRFDEYVTRLIKFIIDSYTTVRRINQRVRIGDIWLTVDKAIPCGLIINELVTNSIKYAFPDKRPDAEIFVELTLENNLIAMTVGDNGIGLPGNIDTEGTNPSLGLRLVNLLTQQLNGSVKIDRTGGTKFTITFNFA